MGGRRVAHSFFFERLHLILRMHAQRNARRLSIRDDGPRQLLVAEVLRQRNCEHPPLTARQEVRRLSVVGPARYALSAADRLDAVVRTDRDVDNLFQVAVEVADQQADAAVRLIEPAFERTGHRFTCVAIRSERQERRLRLRAADRERWNDNGRSHESCGREAIHAKPKHD
jgi:signal-transduction protein with cAMP-binding, CBS, and nucleotidyltransferase domain